MGDLVYNGDRGSSDSESTATGHSFWDRDIV
jgi:hypothetical protein